MSIEKTIWLTELFDIYKSLLTQKQAQMLALYYEEDYSLSEIAEHYGISRQAVRDSLKRGESALSDYEEQLKIHQKRQLRQELLNQLLNEDNQSIIEAILDLDNDRIS
ncbi:YlxM family DNA-binding protein [Eremococcus coleocola]|uniref:YlxM family DNA-binding protein n=1 Tax=Eremococcus coleocola TaxID=88132 RepID=UPI0004298551|nr:YlxM family DNA-binding protein [Eremococcus coleocola]